MPIPRSLAKTVNPRRCCLPSPLGRLGSTTGSGGWIPPSAPDMPRRRDPREASYCDRSDRRVIVVRARLHADATRGGVHVRAPCRPVDLRSGDARQPGDEPISGEIRLKSLSQPQVGTGVQLSRESSSAAEFVAWDWQKGTATRPAHDATIPVSLGREGWTFHVFAPVLGSGLAVIGDVTKFVTAETLASR